MVIAEGSVISDLAQAESKIGEGERGEIRLYLDRSLSADEITQVQNSIVEKGVLLTEPVVQEGRVLSVKFEKRIAPLLIIGLAVGAIAVSVLGWQIYKSGIPLWTWVAAGGILLYLFMQSETGKSASKLGMAVATRRILK